MGEYRVDGSGESRRGQFARRLRPPPETGRGGGGRKTRFSWSKFPRQLSQAATELIDKAAGNKVLPSDPLARAASTWPTASTPSWLSASGKQGLALAEASLLLNPNEPAVHGDALHAILEMNGDWQEHAAGVSRPRPSPGWSRRRRTWRPIFRSTQSALWLTSPTCKQIAGSDFRSGWRSLSATRRLKCARNIMRCAAAMAETGATATPHGRRRRPRSPMNRLTRCGVGTRSTDCSDDGNRQAAPALDLAAEGAARHLRASPETFAGLQLDGRSERLRVLRAASSMDTIRSTTV